MNLRTLTKNMLVPPSTPESQCARILKRLKANGRISNYEIWRMGIRRGAARIQDLKNEGHIIISSKDKGALYWYIYKGHRDEVAE